jgi:hypothetical protein
LNKTHDLGQPPFKLLGNSQSFWITFSAAGSPSAHGNNWFAA